MHTLALAITNRCPLRCDFCCVPPGPGDLDEGKTEEIIDQAIESRLFGNVGFTGGEPLIRHEMVFRLGRKLSKAGIKWGVTTGAGWATSNQKIDQMCQGLFESGIGCITVSVDESHLKGRSANFVGYFIEQLIESKIPTRISCTTNKNIFELPIEVPNSELLSIEYFYVAPVGFAKNVNTNVGNFNFAKSKCPMFNGLTLSVWPSGDVYPCCSTYVVNKEKSLIIGNVYHTSIVGILNLAIKDRYFSSIREVGFSGLAVLVPEAFAWKEAMSRPTIDVCHMCSKLSAAGGVNEFREKLSFVENQILLAENQST